MLRKQQSSDEEDGGEEMVAAQKKAAADLWQLAEELVIKRKLKVKRAAQALQKRYGRRWLVRPARARMVVCAAATIDTQEQEVVGHVAQGRH